WILVASVTATFASIPSRALTVRFAPSTFSIAPEPALAAQPAGSAPAQAAQKAWQPPLLQPTFEHPTLPISWCTDRCRRGWDLSSAAACALDLTRWRYRANLIAVLSDIVMPGKDGLDLLDHMSA